MQDLNIIKIGGNVIDDKSKLSSFLKKYHALPGYKILVHGGGKKASEISDQLGIAPVKIDGRRITDSKTLDIVTMVYAGLINKNIVATLQELNCNAIGLSGADGNLIQGVKRPVKTIDYGFAGDIEATGINKSLLTNLITQGISPVICAITHDGNGQLLNTNADTIATTVASAMASEYNCQLTYCFEKQGVLTDPNDDNSCLAQLNFNSYQHFLQEKVITDGMIPKLKNAFDALASGVPTVYIKNAHSILNNSGTQITLK